MKKRNIITTFLLTFFTCGIYYLYLIYELSYELDVLSGEKRNSPALDLVLSMFTCGLYQIYWFYKMGKQVEELEENLGMRTSSITLLLTIVALLGGGVISMLILINEINRCIDEKAAIY